MRIAGVEHDELPKGEIGYFEGAINMKTVIGILGENSIDDLRGRVRLDRAYFVDSEEIGGQKFPIFREVKPSFQRDRKIHGLILMVLGKDKVAFELRAHGPEFNIYADKIEAMEKPYLRA